MRLEDAANGALKAMRNFLIALTLIGSYVAGLAVVDLLEDEVAGLHG